jgi:hypothetical protein
LLGMFRPSYSAELSPFLNALDVPPADPRAQAQTFNVDGQMRRGDGTIAD